MGGDQISAYVYFHQGGSEDYLGPVADKCIRYGVVVSVAAEIDVSVLLDCHFSVSFHLIWRGWQRTQFRFLYRMEVLFTCIGALLHAGLVVACEVFGYGCVQLFQREELPVTESGVYPVIYYLHLVLYLRFMSGSYRLARYRHEAVVVAHVLHRLVQYRFIPV